VLAVAGLVGFATAWAPTVWGDVDLVWELRTAALLRAARCTVALVWVRRTVASVCGRCTGLVVCARFGVALVWVHHTVALVWGLCTVGPRLLGMPPGWA